MKKLFMLLTVVFLASCRPTPKESFVKQQEIVDTTALELDSMMLDTINH